MTSLSKKSNFFIAVFMHPKAHKNICWNEVWVALLVLRRHFPILLKGGLISLGDCSALNRSQILTDQGDPIPFTWQSESWPACNINFNAMLGFLFLLFYSSCLKEFEMSSEITRGYFNMLSCQFSVFSLKLVEHLKREV